MKFTRLYYFCVLLCLISIPISAQNGGKILFPKGENSFKKLDTDLTTKFNLKKTDTNGKAFAIIKISNNTGKKNFVVNIGVSGNAQIMYDIGVMYVYVPEGVKLMKIAHNDFGVSKPFRFPMPIKSGQVYELEVLFSGGQSKDVLVYEQTKVEGSYINLSIEPKQALVSLDQEPPVLTLENGAFKSDFLAYGKHQVSIIAKNYKPYVEIFDLSDSIIKKEIQLQPNFTNVMLMSTPMSATVLLDGEVKGLTPIKLSMLENGHYEFVIMKKYYDSQTLSLDLDTDGETINKNVTLISNFGEFTIKAGDNPLNINNINILIDQQKMGKDIWNGRLSIGSHVIELQKDGYLSTKQTLNVVKGQKETLYLEAPKPIYGSLNLSAKTVSSDVSVRIDGGEVIELPYISNTIIAGQHKIECFANGFKSKVINIEVKQGEILRRDINLEKGYSSTSSNNKTYKPKTLEELQKTMNIKPTTKKTIKNILAHKEDPKMTFVTKRRIGGWISFRIDAPMSERKNIWIDLNNNGKRDSNEGITSFGRGSSSDKQYFHKSKFLTIHGKVSYFRLTCKCSSLDVSKNPYIKELFAAGIELESLLIGENRNLQKLFLRASDFKSLDLSQCPNLVEVDCAYCRLPRIYIHKQARLTDKWLKYSKASWVRK